jgi:hypothetical protein
MADGTFNPIEKRHFIRNLARELLVKGYYSSCDSSQAQALNALATANALWDAIQNQEDLKDE